MREHSRENPGREDAAEGRIEGRNAVAEAIRSGVSIDKLYIAKGETDRTLARLAADAKRTGAVVVEADRRKLDAMSLTHSHQGVIAVAAAQPYATVEDILRAAEERGEKPLLVVCDEISDPHNLGAIIRTAECAGAHGVIIPKRRSVGLTWAVGKASAGAVEHLPVARVGNLASTLEELKARGLWVYAADMDGAPWCQTDFTGPVALVIGSEGRGVSRLVKEKADFVVSLPLKGKINSLNASVAAGILCYEVSRQRGGLKAVNP